MVTNNSKVSNFCKLELRYSATGLQCLQIDSNNFGGTLPQCLGNLSSSLLFFTADDNSIFGSIPNAMENLHNLEGISLSGNQFSGLIPPEIGRLPKLYKVYIENNSLSGNVPSSFGNLSRLTYLHLEDSNLQGTIPSTLAECPYLMNLTLGGNNFTGIISSALIRSSSSYVHLDLSQNHLTGFLPMEVGQLINLEHFDVSGNLLSGEIPPSLGSCKSIQYLDLQENFFQGTIPSDLSSLRGIGYTPLEYGMGHEGWLHGDMYSYGILLLEMFTGKRPNRDMFQGSSNLHNFVKVALPEQVLDIVDPVLIQEKEEGEMSANQRRTEASTTIRIKFEESLISILETGVALLEKGWTSRMLQL